MKNYEKPIVIENNEAFEGVYAASGEGGYTTDLYFNNHDGGSHSDITFNVEVFGQNYTYIKAVLTWNGGGSPQFYEPSDPSGGSIAFSHSGNVVTFEGPCAINGATNAQNLHFGFKGIFDVAGDGHSFATPDDPNKNNGSYNAGNNNQEVRDPAPFTVQIELS